MTKDLLEKLKNAKTNEEFKQIVEDNKVELTDADLEQIGGGVCMVTYDFACKIYIDEIL